MIRLRQVALVAHDLESVSHQLADHLGLTPCFHDPGVAEFGLRNALYPIGDQLLEVVSPERDGTTAGRLLAKRGGDGGYMVLFETSDLDEHMTVVESSGVRVVWQIDLRDIRARHLHPADVGGAIVSIDQPMPPGSWRWAGPRWQPHQQDSVVNMIAGVTIGANDPVGMRSRWHRLGIDPSMNFEQASERGEGVDGIDLVATDRRARGTSLNICGVTIRLV